MSISPQERWIILSTFYMTQNTGLGIVASLLNRESRTQKHLFANRSEGKLWRLREMFPDPSTSHARYAKLYSPTAPTPSELQMRK